MEEDVDARVTERRRRGGRVVVFCAKLAALEVLRRGCQARCRLVWWAVQGLAVSGAPGLGWLRRCTPFQALADTSESVSKPMIFLSLATVVVSAYNEARERKSDTKDPGVRLPVVETGTSEIEEEVVLVDESKQTPSIAHLKAELRKHGVVLLERLGDDEVERFWMASKGDTAKFVAVMRKTVEWRQSYDFMPQSALREWSTLVFWHRRDAHGRPILIIRLGLASTTFAMPAQRYQFAQAVISQVEYGIQNLVTTDDPRLTVVMDCRGTTAFGFPVQMMKSCIALVQEHYPIRLASLFVVNAPPLVRAVANAIIQLLKPSTREKVRIEGTKYVEVLAKSFGGDVAVVPAALGGACSCATCVVALEENASLTDSLAKQTVEYLGELVSKETTIHDAVISVRHPHLEGLRFIILGLVCLWILVAMVSARS